MPSLPILRVLSFPFLSSLGSCICSLQQPRQKETALPCSLRQLRPFISVHDLQTICSQCSALAVVTAGLKLSIAADPTDELDICWAGTPSCLNLLIFSPLSPSLRKSLVFGSTFAHVTLSLLESSLYNAQDQSYLQGLDKTLDDGCWTTFLRAAKALSCCNSVTTWRNTQFS